MSNKVLIIEDETRVAHWVKSFFEREGFITTVVHDGAEGLRAARMTAPDLIVLDLMLPTVDGTAICRTLRRESDVPIIMLTARDKERERINGLDLGADDYVTKPFSPPELVARAKAVLRRVRGEAQQVLTAENLSLNVTARTCTFEGQAVSLTPTQFNLLATLMRHPNQVLSRQTLLDNAFQDGFELIDRTIDSHIRRIRQQIEPDSKQPRYILTIYGSGYKFVP